MFELLKPNLQLGRGLGEGVGRGEEKKVLRHGMCWVGEVLANKENIGRAQSDGC